MVCPNQNPGIQSPTTSLGARRIYPKITEVVACCPLRLRWYNLGFFLSLNLKTTGADFQAVGRFTCASYAGTELHNIFGFELVLHAHKTTEYLSS